MSREHAQKLLDLGHFIISLEASRWASFGMQAWINVPTGNIMKCVSEGTAEALPPLQNKPKMQLYSVRFGDK